MRYITVQVDRSPAWPRSGRLPPPGRRRRWAAGTHGCCPMFAIAKMTVPFGRENGRHGDLANRSRCGPIGVDIGSRSVKLLQFNAARSDLWETARWDLPPDDRPAAGARDERGSSRPSGRPARAATSAAATPCSAWAPAACSCRTSAWPQATGDELDEDRPLRGRRPPALQRRRGGDPLPPGRRRPPGRHGPPRGDPAGLPPAGRRAAAGHCRGGRAAARWPSTPSRWPCCACYVRQFRRDDDQQQRRMFVNVGAVEHVRSSSPAAPTRCSSSTSTWAGGTSTRRWRGT